MAKMFSENAQIILTHLQNNTAVDETYKDIADALGLDPKSVNGVLNGLQRKGLIERESSAEDAKVKYVRLTPEGAQADPDADKPEA